MWMCVWLLFYIYICKDYCGVEESQQWEEKRQGWGYLIYIFILCLENVRDRFEKMVCYFIEIFKGGFFLICI